MVQRNCKNCGKVFEALEKCHGPYEHLYCSTICRRRAGAIRNYYRRNVTTEDHKRYDIKKRYGITIEQWKEIEKNQNFLCNICLKKERLFVDHCHSTGKIRGLLCYHCNFGIGHFRDSLNLLKEAIVYLEKDPYPFGKLKKKKKKTKPITSKPKKVKPITKLVGTGRKLPENWKNW